MSPSMEFIYSKPYDELARKAFPYLPVLERQEIKRRTDDLNGMWAENGPEIMETAQKVIGMSWEQAQYQCYLVTGPVGFALPLTIGFYAGSKYTTFDILIHELLHIYFLEYSAKYPEKHREATATYGSESVIAWSHVPINALQDYIYTQLGWAERLKAVRKRHDAHSDYRRAWELVDQDESEEILKKLRI